MLNKLNDWGPLTVLLVIVVVLLLVGGLVNVIVDPDYTYRSFLDDLKWLAAGLAAGVAAGKGALTGLRDLGVGININSEETMGVGAAQSVGTTPAPLDATATPEVEGD
jgi:hypothetical protein